MRIVTYESDVQRELAKRIKLEYLTQCRVVGEEPVGDECWLNRFMEQITRECNWEHFVNRQDDLCNIVKYAYRLPKAFKQPVHSTK